MPSRTCSPVPPLYPMMTRPTVAIQVASPDIIDPTSAWIDPQLFAAEVVGPQLLAHALESEKASLKPPGKSLSVDGTLAIRDLDLALLLAGQVQPTYLPPRPSYRLLPCPRH